MKNTLTKIIATISDLRCDEHFLKELYENGMDVVRLNTAHQSFKDTLKVIKNVRKVSDRIALMLDTKGPEIRTTDVREPIIVKKDSLIKIRGGNREDISTKDLLFVNYAQFVKEIPQGTTVLIDDGELALKVIKKSPDHLLCKVQNDGIIKSHKSINVPDVHLKLPSLSKKDEEYIKFAIEHDLDFIAHSFVRNKEDVMGIQKILDAHNSQIKIIAKIENREGVENIDEILDHVYGIMIARGDLGIEIPAEEVPLIQKGLIKKCMLRQKPIITATQMLHTMIKNPRPTRAEVSDVANAILDGTDAIMLSGETAFGDYPVEAVKTMTKIAKKIEAEIDISDSVPIIKTSNRIVDVLAKSTLTATKQLPIREIIVSTPSGFSAEVIASYRGRVPILVKCFDKRRVRELALTYGVTAYYIPSKDKNKNLIKLILSDSVKNKKLSKRDLVIFLAGDRKEDVMANFMEICEVGKYVF